MMPFMSESKAKSLEKHTQKYVWEHNPHLHKDKMFQKLCGKNHKDVSGKEVEDGLD